MAKIVFRHNSKFSFMPSLEKTVMFNGEQITLKPSFVGRSREIPPHIYNKILALREQGLSNEERAKKVAKILQDEFPDNQT